MFKESPTLKYDYAKIKKFVAILSDWLNTSKLQ